MLEEIVFGLSLYSVLPGIYYDPEPLHIYYKHPSSITNASAANDFVAICRILIACGDCEPLISCAVRRPAFLRSLSTPT